MGHPLKAQLKVGFVKTMRVLTVRALPIGTGWIYDLNLDGVRLEAVKTEGHVDLYSHLGNVVNRKFPLIAEALEHLPDGTVVDGQLVTLDGALGPNFDLRHNFRVAQKDLQFQPFDILFHSYESLTRLPLRQRQNILASTVAQSRQVALAPYYESAEQHKEDAGLRCPRFIAKRADGIYEPGLRTGLWQCVGYGKADRSAAETQ